MHGRRRSHRWVLLAAGVCAALLMPAGTAIGQDALSNPSACRVASRSPRCRGPRPRATPRVGAGRRKLHGRWPAGWLGRERRWVLPFTGMDLGVVAGTAVALLAVGFVLREAVCSALLDNVDPQGAEIRPPEGGVETPASRKPGEQGIEARLSDEGGAEQRRGDQAGSVRAVPPGDSRPPDPRRHAAQLLEQADRLMELARELRREARRLNASLRASRRPSAVRRRRFAPASERSQSLGRGTGPEPGGTRDARMERA